MSDNGQKPNNYVRRHAASISISTVTTLLAIVPAFWFLAKPVLVGAVSDAVAEDIKKQVEDGIEPVGNAFKVLLQNQMNTLRREIGELENKRQFSSNEWTTRDARLLTDKNIELQGLQDALKELE